MKGVLALVLALLATGCSALQRDESLSEFDTATQADKAGDFHLLVGVRSFDDEAWDELDDQAALGFIWSAEPAGSWVGWEVGLLGSWDDATVRTPNGPKATANLDSYTIEGSLGLVKSILVGERLRPYVGAGAALLYVDFEAPLDGTSEVIDDEDQFFGGYARAGLLFQWTDSNHIGLDYRVFRGGSGSVAGVDYDTDSEQLALVFGASF